MNTVSESNPMENQQLVQLLRKCPTEIVHLIFEFHGYHKLRNGKYMRQLDIHSPKYELLRHVHESIYISRGWGVECRFIKQYDDKILKYRISSITYQTYVEWVMHVSVVYPLRKSFGNHQVYEYDMVRCMVHR